MLKLDAEVFLADVSERAILPALVDA